jgi:hypothetical protein
VSIKLVSQNTVVRIYYKSDNLASGDNVVFNIWDDTGTQLSSNTPADGEIGNKGIYYLDITTPNKDVYLLAKASLENKSSPAPYVLRVGNPDQKVFYVDPKYRTGNVQPYEIYTLSGAILQSGNLFESNGGFYYADVSSIESGEPLFFESGVLSQAFEISALAYTGEGGVIIGGEAQSGFTFSFRTMAEGGVVVSGEAGASFNPGADFVFAASGGVIVSGEAKVRVSLSEYEYTASGGLVAGGEAETRVSAQYYSYEATGGLVASGTATVEATFRFRGREYISVFEIGDRIPFKEVKAIYYDGTDNYYVTGDGTVFREDQALHISAYNARQKALYGKIYQESLRLYDKLENTTGRTAQEGIFEIPLLTSESAEIFAQLADLFEKNAQAIRGITPVPAQGSIVAISEDEENIDLDRAAEIALSKIEKIKEINPSYATGSLFAIVEDSSDSALNLNELLNNDLAILNKISGIVPSPSSGDFVEVGIRKPDEFDALSKEREEALKEVEKLKNIDPKPSEGGKVEV